MTLAPDFRRFHVSLRVFTHYCRPNLQDKACNLSTISKMNARRIKDTKKGWEKKKNRREKRDPESSTGSDFHCDQPEWEKSIPFLAQ